MGIGYYESIIKLESANCFLEKFTQKASNAL